MPENFVLWAVSDAHVGADLNQGRRSLADAIIQAENGGSEGSPSFDWDIMIDLGDMSGNQGVPGDDEGEEIARQYSVSTKHPREHIYNLVGNHDASTVDQPTQWWFRKWIDPTGENSEFSGVYADKRSFPVEGSWERYKFQFGNVVVLMMGDRNDVGPPIGRAPLGGYPAGAVTQETFEWWADQVESNRDKIIISAHHHMLRETTVGSGDWEGVDNSYHGRFEDGAPIGTSYVYWVGTEPGTQQFEKYLAQNPGAIDLWLGAHTHTHPDDRLNGRSHIERKWDVTFMNVAALSKYHGKRNIPMSRVLTFTEGNNQLNIRYYLHSSHYAPQGWYPPSERTVALRVPFEAP